MLTTRKYSTSIARRLSTSLLALLLLLLAVAGLNAYAMIGMGEQLQRIVEVNNRKSELASRVLSGIDAMVIQANSISLLTDTKEIAGAVAALHAAENEYESSEGDLKRLISSTDSAPTETALMSDIEALRVQTLPFLQRAASEGQQGANIESASTLTKEVRPRAAEWRMKVGDLVEAERQLNAHAARRAMDSKYRALLGALTLVIVATVCGTLLVWWLVRSIRVPINHAIGLAQQISEGDLSSNLPTSSLDEVGRLLEALSAMQVRLRTLVSEIRVSAESMYAASAEVAIGSQDLSNRTEQAAANVQSTASSMKQISRSIHDTADAADAANRMAAVAAAEARDGGALVSNVVTTMGSISARSRRIFETIGVIDAIALRTNILALNAAVEAARAGEKGQGFAVVAHEVRALAQRAADAAKDIKELVEQSIESLDEGTQVVGAAGASMGKIVGSVVKVCDEISKISATSAGQSDEIALIDQAVGRLDGMTQQNAALVEQSAAAAAHLQGQCERLTALVAMFRIEDAESVATPAADAIPPLPGEAASNDAQPTIYLH